MKLFFKLTLKIYNSEEHLVSILSFSQTQKYETVQTANATVINVVTFKTLVGNNVLNNNF